jgi:homoserine acetyltransferase
VNFLRARRLKVADGEYQQEPTRMLRIAAGILFIAGNCALEFQRAAPTTAATDRYFQEHVEAMTASLDANDLLYALNASRNYDPSSTAGRPCHRAPLDLYIFAARRDSRYALSMSARAVTAMSWTRVLDS